VTGILIAVAIVLVIVTLVVRDQTEFKLGRLRGQLLALRSEEQRLGEDRVELERLVAQTAEALMRADSRLRAVTAAAAELTAAVTRLTGDAGPDQPPSTEPATEPAADPAPPDPA
jgi:hypothetical protein